MEKAARVGAASRLLDAGQSCIAAKRFIVMKSIADEFTSKFIEFVSGFKVGNPMDADTDIGPLVREQQIEALEEQVKDALSKGAAVLLKGGDFRACGAYNRCKR